MKIQKKTICFPLMICLTLAGIGLLGAETKAYADVASGQNWTIEIDTVKIKPFITPEIKKKDPEPQIDTPAMEPTYSPDENPFSLSISGSIIDFGQITPTNPTFRTNNIVVSGFPDSFFLIGYATNPLNIIGTGTFLPDTTCDNGSCTQKTASLWENTLTYGFGFRCDNVSNHSCPLDFSQTNYYKQFSDTSIKEAPEIIFSSISGHKTSEIQITYKLNISKTQEAGIYTNTITYIAVPGY